MQQISFILSFNSPLRIVQAVFLWIFKMKILRKTIAPILLTLSLTSIVQAQGIPTIDASSIAKSVEQIAQMKEQIENQVKQISELKNQVTALTSLDGLKNAAQDLTLDNIPTEWKDIYKDIDGLSKTDVDSILSLNSYDPEGGRKMLANHANNLESAFKETTERFGRLNNLQEKLQTATNVKEAADIQNQIATESAAIAVSQTQLDNMQRSYEIQKEIHAEQSLHNDYCSSMKTRGRNPVECQ